jgi:hypothetical protein
MEKRVEREHSTKGAVKLAKLERIGLRPLAGKQGIVRLVFERACRGCWEVDVVRFAEDRQCAMNNVLTLYVHSVQSRLCHSVCQTLESQA